jgi:hypothetical protein
MLIRSGVVCQVLVLTAQLLAAASAVSATPDASAYDVQFRLELEAGRADARATIRIVQPEQALRRLRLRLPETLFSAISADGRLERETDYVVWHVPARGGEIRYRVQISHQRDAGAYDALVTPGWAIFRGDDVFPPAEVTQKPGARGRAELLLDLPPGWRAVTPWRRDASGRRMVSDPERSYARPVGWMAAGHLGSRTDNIGPTRVIVAAPKGQGVQRVPMMALIRWTLPLLQANLDEVPAFLPVVAAGDPMWRGGLSAPNSLFVHAGRPLISENGTSTLVHELVHVLMPVPAADEHDWIDEGLAEYLGLVVLERSGTISRERFDRAIASFQRRGTGLRSLKTKYASGAVLARAVVIFHELDRELQQRSGGRKELFDLARRLTIETQPVDLKRLRALAAEVAGGGALKSLSAPRLPGAD